ncbi:DUF732 domain-containing protein [Streptomyces sp. SA15]|uniref:DUF732 domain-containing protein n=1 Tax=Streptomyces sp. SA15 TaxID=934019 RepID=UPI001C52ADF1|nr:DUF732 domain-containing protein [Streptomyces sp. SA15]
MSDVRPRPDEAEPSRRVPGADESTVTNGARPRRRWVAGAGAVVLVLVAGAAMVVNRYPDDARPQPGPAPLRTSASKSAASPGDGPPYVAVPQFTSTAARDTAFVGDVAPFSTWPSGTVSYGVMSSMPGGSDISDFRTAVIKDAKAVCEALAGGTDMNEVPDAVGLPLTDQVDQAGFIVEAATFYCPDQMAAVTDGVYSQPVPTEQREDCPTARALEVSASVEEQSGDDLIHTASYSVEVHNTSSYTVRAQLQQRWFADGYPGEDEWESFGDVTADPVVTIEAGDTFTYEGEQSGIYRWERTEVRVQPGQFVFIGCGYQPGPGTAGTDEE